MADINPSIFNIETLNALGARLFDHAEDIGASLEFEPVVLDLKLAARACSRFASLRFQVSAIATAAPPAIRRDLHTALEEASQR